MGETMLRLAVLGWLSWVARGGLIRERCFAFCGKASTGGGLASYLYHLNAVAIYAARRHDARLLVTEVSPSSRKHRTGSAFRDVLGPPEWRCTSPVRPPAGAAGGRTGGRGRRGRGRTSARPGGRRASEAEATAVRGGTCGSEVKAWLSGASRDAPVLSLAGRWAQVFDQRPRGCDEVVEIGDGCGSSTNFSSTRDFFRENYRRGARAGAARRRGAGRDGLATVAIHYRLGDTTVASETKHGEKRTTPAEAAQIAAILKAAVDRAGNVTLEVRIISDSRGHPEVAALAADLALSPKVTVLPLDARASESETARGDFDALVDADVVACAHSGFCRVAALLSDGAVLASDQATGHRLVPLAALPNAVSYNDATTDAAHLGARLADQLRRALDRRRAATS